MNVMHIGGSTMKINEILVEQDIGTRFKNFARSMVQKAKGGDIGGAADDMEKMHNNLARMDLGSGLLDMTERMLAQLKDLVASNPNHPEAPKFVQAIRDIEAELPALKQAAADSRRMAVDAGAGRQDAEVGMNETTSAGAVAAVATPVGGLVSRQPRNADGTAKNGLDSDNVLSNGKPKSKSKNSKPKSSN